MTEQVGATRTRTGRTSSFFEANLDPGDRIAELEQRLERLEGSQGLRERGRSVLDRVMPPEAGTHFRNAGREQLMGVRSIVDFWIRRLDESENRAGAARTSDRETIKIE